MSKVKQNLNRSSDTTDPEVAVQKAADAVKVLIHSIATTVEQKVAFEDQIDNLSRETGYLLDEIDSVQDESKRKILLAYKQFLLQNIESVDNKLKEMK